MHTSRYESHRGGESKASRKKCLSVHLARPEVSDQQRNIKQMKHQAQAVNKPAVSPLQPLAGTQARRRWPQGGKRNPDRTREVLLQAAFEEIHRTGFQAASVDAILARTGVTKGALYHHFPTKTQLGYAVVEEVIRQRILQRWGHEVREGEDPIAHLIEKLRFEAQHRWPLAAIQVGCPVNNLANEMSPIDEGFRQRIEQVFHDWKAIIAQLIRQGQKSGHVRSDVKPEQVATFFVAAVEGTISMAKNAQDPKLLRDNFTMLQTYLAALRPTPGELRTSRSTTRVKRASVLASP